MWDRSTEYGVEGFFLYLASSSCCKPSPEEGGTAVGEVADVSPAENTR